MLFHIVNYGAFVYRLGHKPFTPVRGVRFPYALPNLGLKVFMDAHSTVTAEEGDRYPLGPPSLRATSPGHFPL